MSKQHGSSVAGAIRELLETALVIVLVLFTFRSVVQNFRIEGQSMEPNFHNHQFIWVNKLLFFHFDTNAPRRLLFGQSDAPSHVVYPIRTPQRGDVVVLEPPTSTYASHQEDYIKRVIGLPGELIQIKDGKVFINGYALAEDVQDGGYLTETTDCYGGPLCQPYRIPPNNVIVLGDHRSNSQDSRTWNGEPALPLNRIVGKAWFSYWPQQDWGLIPTPTYAQSPHP